MSTKNINALTSKNVNLNFEITKEDVVDCLISRDAEKVAAEIKEVTKKIKEIEKEEEEVTKQLQPLLQKDVVSSSCIDESIQEEETINFMVGDKDILKLIYERNRQLALYNRGPIRGI